jgi:hypothetical protein
MNGLIKAFSLEVRKMAVIIKLLQFIIWVCYVYIKDFFQVDYILVTSC